MTGLSLALQLLICEPSTSRISSESAGLATSSWCGRTLSYNSQGQVFQPRKTGPHRSVCLCPLLLKLSIFSGDMGLHIRQDFAAHCDFFLPFGRVGLWLSRCAGSSVVTSRGDCATWPALAYVPHLSCCSYALA